jgi:hypothetical protein
MRKSLTAAIVAAAAATAMGGGIAAASTQSAATGTTGTEHFQMMTTSGTATTDSVIATGLFTAPGVDHEGSSTATFAFANGKVTLKHSPGSGQQSMNPKSCLLTVNLHGTYKIIGGTGRYAGITGHGHYKLSILAVGARSGGKCSQSKPPVAWHQVINASGPVALR